jgi:hypothetical protein
MSKNYAIQMHVLYCCLQCVAFNFCRSGSFKNCGELPQAVVGECWAD